MASLHDLPTDLIAKVFFHITENDSKWQQQVDRRNFAHACKWIHDIVVPLLSSLNATLGRAEADFVSVLESFPGRRLTSLTINCGSGDRVVPLEAALAAAQDSEQARERLLSVTEVDVKGCKARGRRYSALIGRTLRTAFPSARVLSLHGQGQILHGSLLEELAPLRVTRLNLDLCACSPLAMVEGLSVYRDLVSLSISVHHAINVRPLMSCTALRELAISGNTACASGLPDVLSSLSTLQRLSVPSSSFILPEAVQSGSLGHLTIKSMVLAHTFPPALSLKFPALERITVHELRLCAPHISAEAEASLEVLVATSSILSDLPLSPGPNGGVLLCGPVWSHQLSAVLCPALQPLSGSSFSKSVRSMQLSTPFLTEDMLHGLARIFPFTTSIHCSSACKIEHTTIPHFVAGFSILSRLRFTLSLPFDHEALLEALTAAHLRERHDSAFIMECVMYGRPNEWAEFEKLRAEWEEKRETYLPPCRSWKSMLVHMQKSSLLW